MIVFGFSFSFLSWNFLEIMLVHSFQLTNKSTQWYMDGSSFSFLMEFPWDPNVWCIASVGQTNHNPYIIASVGQTNPTQWYVGRAQRTNFMKICLARFSHRAFYISLEGLCFFFFFNYPECIPWVFIRVPLFSKWKLYCSWYVFGFSWGLIFQTRIWHELITKPRQAHKKPSGTDLTLESINQQYIEHG